jgi:hypothetical protein
VQAHCMTDMATSLTESISHSTTAPACPPLVQLPMYNEDVHCERVIRCACRIAWPRDKLLIQVGWRVLLLQRAMHPM